MQHPLIPLILTTYHGYFKSIEVVYHYPDENIREPYLTIQGSKPSKKGSTVYALTFTVFELETEIYHGEGLESYLLSKLAGVFNTKDLSDYLKVR